ncbi:aminotransferase class III-fold pyridoxal phosphate-dependent enzyme [Hymenobacter sp. BT186]|uniref:Aminotransferase class III-fold pyridoxal phosphate-dependent enzyme n=1 Tax=Hymenobacter telluris TaxID=2816474 RepID=A0A939EUM7_9BACT|nr:aminotransferase class III-fold pyridoxal phosphate-dependent enzyme [Hymenobacter telluris]MBO0357291.1 aminotransferase class III-fold pyridoxal phosphate-dependent enzyme [Hymenobacter telluris]MBW3373317.1 aminotransferase class III-fold pyridoxal phosphate-dependent enzyme [Hymenobacter norwichensis]
MELFNVYPLVNITPVKALGAKLWDDKGQEYLDFYGGHAVISIGHSHPHYVQRLTEQLQNIGFYSNSVQIPIQQELARKLGQVSDYEDYSLFLCNSGAEANENALKLASFHTGKKRVLAFKGAFHGRTSGAVAATDNPKIVAPFNAAHAISFVEYDLAAVEQVLQGGDVCAAIIEPIQGVGGIIMPSDEFLGGLAALCKQYGALLLADEVQSGYGRSGKFFAHQHAGIRPDVISIAKGMGNGFPIGGILIAPELKASYGLLGTTFGGNHLACAAALAVLEVIEQEDLLNHATELGHYLRAELEANAGAEEIRGRGLMVGIKYDFPIKDVRDKLLSDFHIFVGNASDPTVLRLLPPLNITKAEVDRFLQALYALTEKAVEEIQQASALD